MYLNATPQSLAILCLLVKESQQRGDECQVNDCHLKRSGFRFCTQTYLRQIWDVPSIDPHLLQEENREHENFNETIRNPLVMISGSSPIPVSYLCNFEEL